MAEAQPTTELLPDFASDNVAGVCPELLEAVTAIAAKTALPYGGDSATQALEDWALNEFGELAKIYPVFNGTGANVIALQAATTRWGAVICAPEAHINHDEGGAPERIAGLRLLHRPPTGSKLSCADIAALKGDPGFVHGHQAQVVSVTQPSEEGELYTLAELQDLSTTAHQLDMAFHIDGARISNAAAALGCSIGEATAAVGADILSLGGTKNGAMAAEAVVVINPQRIHGIEYIRKYSMQLASKQSFLSAQLLALFSTQLWQRNAAHAHAKAELLARGLEQLPGVALTKPVRVNAVFPEVPTPLMSVIQQRYLAHHWGQGPSGQPVLRLMCSWQTTDEQIQRFLAYLAQHS